MHTPLQIRERNVLRNLVTKHPIYLLVKDMVLELDEQCYYFHLTPEDVFLEIINLVDAIRDPGEEQPYDVIEHCQRLKLHYKEITSNHEAIKDIELWISVIIYYASNALTIVKTKPYESVASILRNNIPLEHTDILLPYVTKAILKLSNAQFEEWDQYFASDTYISEELITSLEQSDYFCCIVREPFKDNPVYTLDSYENQLRTACTKGAPYLIRMLKRGEGLGYLDFEDVDIKTIYDALVDHFPNTIDYGYKHFANTAKAYTWHSRKKQHDNHRTQK